MRRLALAFALAAVPATAGLAHAEYCTVPVPLPNGMNANATWGAAMGAGPEIHYAVNTTPPMDLDATMVKAAAQAAFQTWQDVDCSDLTFVGDPDVMTTTFPNSAMNIHVQFAHAAATWQPSNQPLNRVAATYFVYDENGKITSASIMLNAVPATEGGMGYGWSLTGEMNKFDVQSVLTTQVGRIIGLGSNPTNMMSVMYPSFRTGDTSKRMLHDDDRNALRFLYPPVDMGACMAPPPPADPATCMSMGGGGSGGGAAGTGGGAAGTGGGAAGTGGGAAGSGGGAAGSGTGGGAAGSGTGGGAAGSGTGGGAAGSGTGGGAAGSGGGAAGAGGGAAGGGGTDDGGCAVAAGSPSRGLGALALLALGLVILRRRR